MKKNLYLGLGILLMVGNHFASSTVKDPKASALTQSTTQSQSKSKYLSQILSGLSGAFFASLITYFLMKNKFEKKIRGVPIDTLSGILDGRDNSETKLENIKNLIAQIKTQQEANDVESVESK